MPTSPIFKRSNSDILNVMRGNATPDYQRHVPVATQANLHETFQAITSDRGRRNEFEQMLVNKIAKQLIRDISWNNPLAVFKGPQLTYGSTIEEIQVGLLNAYAHDDGADYGDSAIWSREFPRVDVAYHTVNRKDKYKITIPDEALRGAFLSGDGLGAFAAQLLAAPNTSDARDEYLIMRDLFRKYADADGFYDLGVPDLSTIESTPDEARRVLRQLRAIGGQLQFLSDRYNAARMPVAAKPEEMRLFITPEANAAIDVDALAGMFNIDRGEVGTRTTLIDSFPGDPGAFAVLTTDDFFVVADQVYETASIHNPANLTQQHFLHHWQVVSASRFVPAIKLTSRPKRQEIRMQNVATATLSPLTVTDIDGATVTEVERGASYRVTGHGLAEDGTFRTATVYELSSAQSEVTTLTQNGTLYVAQDETADELTVTQTATDNGITESTTLTVTGTAVILWPNAQALPDDDGDGLDEVTPVVPESFDGVVTIPNVRGVQYQVGDGTTQTNAANGTRHDVPVTVTAVARSGYELATGADAGPWNITE